MKKKKLKYEENLIDHNSANWHDKSKEIEKMMAEREEKHTNLGKQRMVVVVWKIGILFKFQILSYPSFSAKIESI